MDRVLEKYLDDINKCLGRMPLSEKVDIISNMKTKMLELKDKSGLTSNEIVKRLGNPKVLASSYLTKTIIKDNKCSKTKIFRIISLWTLASLGILFVIPVLGSIAISFIASAVIVPIACLIRLISYYFGYDMSYIGIKLGTYTLAPIPSFLVSILVSVIMMVIGMICWKLMLIYIRHVNKKVR